MTADLKDKQHLSRISHRYRAGSLQFIEGMYSIIAALCIEGVATGGNDEKMATAGKERRGCGRKERRQLVARKIRVQILHSSQRVL